MKSSGTPNAVHAQASGAEHAPTAGNDASAKDRSNDRFLRSRITAFNFTRRQQDVVELVLQGMSNREIARHLKIEVDTVKVHLREIFLKLNVHRRAALVAKLLTPPFSG
jgi:DNA-binding NarL/FixJ family response regulator